MFPVLFTFEMPFTGWTIPVQSYGICVALGFALGLWCAFHRAAQRGIDREVILDIGLYSVICGILGARLTHILIFHTPDPGGHHFFLEFFAVGKGGLIVLGGLWCAILVNCYYLHANKQPIGVVADCFAPGIALGMVLGRIGCFLNGCCWGRICPPDTPGAVQFPIGSPSFQHYLRLHEDGALNVILGETGHSSLARLLEEHPWDAIARIPLYPTQLISAGLLLGIFLVLRVIEKHPPRKDGLVMLYFLTLYSLSRFLLENWRDDTPPLALLGPQFAPLRLGQIMATATLLMAIGVFIVSIARHSPDATNDAAAESNTPPEDSA